MKYIPRACGSAFWPKIFGTYESELWPFLDIALAHEPSLIVDVGAAEGYYAVGMLLRAKSDCRCIAFEMSRESRQSLSELAAVNGVSARLEVRAACSGEELARLLAEHEPGAFVLCDVEGAEDEILPKAAAGLSSSYVLVEVHEMLRAGVLGRLLACFDATHYSHLIPARIPKVAEINNALLRTLLSMMSVVAPRKVQRAVYERPPGMCFLFLVPKGAAC